MASKPKIPTLALNNGENMPIIGFGTGVWKRQPSDYVETVKDVLDVGYRHLDGALAYGNEKEVGEGIKAKIDEGVVKRDELFIVSKLWGTFHRPDLVVPALKKTLSDLGLKYLDLYLIHWPMGLKEGGDLHPQDDDKNWLYSEVDYVDTWKAMEECVRLGLTKSIGISNFNSQQIDRLLSTCTIKPVVNQVECHPYLAQYKLVEFCKSRGIAITAYSPFGSPDRPWKKPTDPKFLDEPLLAEIGNKYGKSPAQVILRWIVQRGIIVIPQSSNKGRMSQNLEIFDFVLSDEDMEKIKGLDCNARSIALIDWFKNHKYYPFNIEF